MKKILAVDDNEINLQILEYILIKEGYNVQTVLDPKAVMSTCVKYLPDLIMLDITMPEINGYTICKMLKETELTRNIPVIFVSALSDTENLVDGFSYGAVDYITKPFKVEEVKVRVATHIKLYELQKELEKHNHSLEVLVQEQFKKISDAQTETIFSLAKLAQSRDDDTGSHLERVQKYCLILSEQLAKDSKYSPIITPKFIEHIVNASPLHDIGKVGISDLILLKPGGLTNEEFEIMKTHTKIGAETLEDVDKKFGGTNSFITMGKLIARHHHERWDGKGYPDGLAKENIPLPARIMAVADVYDAVSSNRVYRDALPHSKCVEIIKNGVGTQFDPELIDAFLKVQDKFYAVNIEFNGSESGQVV